MKNKIKLTILSFGICLVTLGTINAQESKTQEVPQQQIRKFSPEQRAEKRTQLLKDKLQLSDDQVTKVKSAMLQFEQARTDSKIDMKKNREVLDASFKSILTPEQQKMHKEMQEQKRSEIKEKRKGTDGKAIDQNEK